MSQIVLIAAVADNGCIGLNNQLPWHIPEDLQRFKSLTMGQTLVMGRKTYDSIIQRSGKPLPGREHWVLSRDPRWHPAADHLSQVRRISSMPQAIAQAKALQKDALWVIGGAEVYALALPFASHLEITRVALSPPGDAFFPEWNTEHLQKTFKLKEGPAPEKSRAGIEFQFLRYKRKSEKIRVGALVLAAGEGRRLGCIPKSLIQINGQPIISGLIQALIDTGVDDITVVLGFYQDQIAAALKGKPVRIIVHPDPAKGQASSMQLGLSQMSDTLDGAIIALADQPFLQKNDLRDLICQFKKRPERIEMVYPLVSETPGNPVMISENLRRELVLTTTPVSGLQWRQTHPSQSFGFPSSNLHYTIDIDTTEDLTRFSQLVGPA